MLVAKDKSSFNFEDFKNQAILDMKADCACQKISEKWISPLSNWALTISQLDVYFEGRLNLKING